MATDKRTSKDLIRDLTALEGSKCTECSRLLCGHHTLVSLVMGFKNAPRCAACLAAALDHPYERFRDQVVELVNHRECYRSGWKWADRQEGVGLSPRPPCLWPNGTAEAKKGKGAVASPAKNPPPAPDAQWDAGDMGCGDLVLELRLRLTRMNPGQVLQLTARDPGAPEDLPAWCRLTGHALLQFEPPVYWIRKKES